ncbi:MAG: hypothetical protein QM760_15160 [Nibricoccus sp.]
MKKLLVPVVAIAASLALSVGSFAGPTTLPSTVLDSVRGKDWSTIPQKLKLQYASTAVEPDQARLTTWINEYRSMEEKFRSERRVSFEKSVHDTQVLRDGGYLDLAMDGVADAYTLAEDKKSFAREQWVMALRASAVQMAEASKGNGDWLKARRIYANLSVLEPTDSKWTKAVDEMVRRIRVLTRYAPENFAGTLQREIEYRKAAKKLLVSTTQPTTKPTTKPVDATAEEPVESEEQIAQNLKSEWQQELKGVKLDMLREALVDARTNYYKDISYSQILTGGLEALQDARDHAGPRQDVREPQQPAASR